MPASSSSRHPAAFSYGTRSGAAHELDNDAPSPVLREQTSLSPASSDKSFQRVPSPGADLISNLVPGESPNDPTNSLPVVEPVSTGTTPSLSNMILTGPPTPSFTSANNALITIGGRTGPESMASARPLRSTQAMHLRTSRPQPAKRYLFSSASNPATPAATATAAAAGELRGVSPPASSTSLLVPENLSSSAAGALDPTGRPAWANVMGGSTSNNSANHNNTYYREPLTYEAALEPSSMSTAASLMRSSGPNVSGPRRTPRSGAPTSSSSVIDPHGRTLSGADTNTMWNVSGSTPGTSFAGLNAAAVTAAAVGSLSTSTVLARSGASSAMPATATSGTSWNSPASQVLFQAPLSEGVTNPFMGTASATGNSSGAEGPLRPQRGVARKSDAIPVRRALSPGATTATANVHVPSSIASVRANQPATTGDFLVPAAQRPPSTSSTSHSGPSSSTTGTSGTTAAASYSQTTVAQPLSLGSHRSGHAGGVAMSCPPTAMTGGYTGLMETHSGSEPISGSFSTNAGSRLTEANSQVSNPGHTRYATGSGTGTPGHAPVQSTRHFLFPKPAEPMVLPHTTSTGPYAGLPPAHQMSFSPPASPPPAELTTVLNDVPSARVSQGSATQTGYASPLPWPAYAGPIPGNHAVMGQQHPRTMSTSSNPGTVSISPMLSSQEPSVTTQSLNNQDDTLLAPGRPARSLQGQGGSPPALSSAGPRTNPSATPTTTTSTTPSRGRRSPAVNVDSAVQTTTVSPTQPDTTPTSTTTNATTVTTTTTTTSVHTPSANTPSGGIVSAFSRSLVSAADPSTSPRSPPSSLSVSSPGMPVSEENMSPAQLFALHSAQHQRVASHASDAAESSRKRPPSVTSAATALPAAVGADSGTDADDSTADATASTLARRDKNLDDSPLTLSADDVEASAHLVPSGVVTAMPSPHHLAAEPLSRYGSVHAVSEGSTFTTTDTRSPLFLYPSTGPSETAPSTGPTTPGLGLGDAPGRVTPSSTGPSSVPPLSAPLTPTPTAVADVGAPHNVDGVEGRVAAETEDISAFFQRRRKHRPPPLFGPSSTTTPPPTNELPAAPSHTSSPSLEPARTPLQSRGSVRDDSSLSLSLNREVLGDDTAGDASQSGRGSYGSAGIGSDEDLRLFSTRSSPPSSEIKPLRTQAPPALVYGENSAPRHADPYQSTSTSMASTAAKTSQAATQLAQQKAPSGQLKAAGGVSPVFTLPTSSSGTLRTPTAAVAGSSATTSATSAGPFTGSTGVNSPTTASASGCASLATEDTAAPRVRRRKAPPPNLFSVSSATVGASGSPNSRSQPLPQSFSQHAHSQMVSSASSSYSAHPRSGDGAPLDSTFTNASVTARTASLGGSLSGSARTTPAFAGTTRPSGTRRSHVHRGPLVRVSHDGTKLVAGPFRVSADGCLTVRNVLLLNPTRIDAAATASGLAGPATPEMLTLHSTLSGTGFLSNSNMASPIAALPGAAIAFNATAGAGTQATQPLGISTTAGSLLSPHVVSGLGDRSCLAQPQTPLNLQATAASASTRLLKPGNVLYLSTTPSGLASPMATPELNGLAPPLPMGNASFTLQSTSYETPYSPITYSMDGCRFPQTTFLPSTSASSVTMPAAASAASFLYAPAAAPSPQLSATSNTGGDVPRGMPPRSQSRLANAPGGANAFARSTAAEDSSGTSSPRFYSTSGRTPVSSVVASPGAHSSVSISKSHQAKFASYSGTASPTLLSGTRRRPAAFGSSSPTSASPSRQFSQPTQRQQQQQQQQQQGGLPRVPSTPGALNTGSGQGSLNQRASPFGSSHTGCYTSAGSVVGNPMSPHVYGLEDTASSLLLPYSVVQARLLHAAGSPQSTSALEVNAVRYSDLDLCMRIGEGASASVFVAIHRPTGRRLAVKRIDLSPLCLTFDGNLLSPTSQNVGDGPSGRASSTARNSMRHRVRRRVAQLNARAKQLEHIVTRELLVLHLTYRSPFVVKVYNAFFFRDESALDVVMEFMHYGSLDHLMEMLEKHAKEVHRRALESSSSGSAKQESPLSSEEAESSVTPLTVGTASPSLSPGFRPAGAQSGSLNASSTARTPTTTGSNYLQPDTLTLGTPLSAVPSSHGGGTSIGSSDGDEGIEEEERGVAERVVAVVGEQLLRGLRDMHERGYIHRDIKPGNVLVNEHGVVKLSDFGLSQRCDESGAGITNPLFKSTQALTRVPTPLTASPVTQGSGFNGSNSGLNGTGTCGSVAGSGTPQAGNSPAMRPQLSPSWTTSNASRPHVSNPTTGLPPAGSSLPPPFHPPPAPLPFTAATATAAASSSVASSTTPSAAYWNAPSPSVVQDHFSPHTHSTTPRLFHPSHASLSQSGPPHGKGSSGDMSSYSPAAVTPMVSAANDGAPDSVNTTMPLIPTSSTTTNSPMYSPRPRPPALQELIEPLATDGNSGGNSGLLGPDDLTSPPVQPLVNLADPGSPGMEEEERDSQLEYGADIKRELSTSSSTTTSDNEAANMSNESTDDDSLHCSGTDKYMSPERQRGDQHGKPSDVWAVGVTLAEFALGFYPYDLLGVTDEFERMQRMEKPVIISALLQKRRVQLSPLFGDFIALATLPIPSERPTAKELLEHPFFRQWTTARPFNLKRYLAARVPVPSNAMKEEYLRKQREQTAVPNLVTYVPPGL